MTLVYLFLFGLVTAGMMAGLLLLVPLVFPDEERIRQRLRTEFRDGAAASASASSLFNNLEKVRLDGAANDLSEAEMARIATAANARIGWSQRLQELFLQAELNWTPRGFLAWTAGLALVFGLAVTLFLGPILGAIAALPAGLIPWLYAKRRRNARREKLVAQLPSAFDLMARVLRAGHLVPQALQAVADAFPQPIAGEFTRCQHQQNLGLHPEVVFQEMATRTNILEMRIFVMAMLIQRQTGGKLSEVLERLAHLIRARARLKRQIKTLTAEGRLQGLTLVFLPFIVFALIFFVNREYAVALLEHTGLLIGTGVSMTVGVLWIRSIVHFEV